MLFQYKVKYYDEINYKEQEMQGIVYGRDFRSCNRDSTILW